MYWLKAMLGYWVAKYDADVLGHILGGMTNEVNTIGSPNDARPWKWVARANVLSRMCLYHHIFDRDWVARQMRSTLLGRQMMQGHWNWLLGPTCWVGCVYMHYSRNMNCWEIGWQCINYWIVICVGIVILLLVVRDNCYTALLSVKFIVWVMFYCR